LELARRRPRTVLFISFCCWSVFLVLARPLKKNGLLGLGPFGAVKLGGQVVSADHVLGLRLLLEELQFALDRRGALGNEVGQLVLLSLLGQLLQSSVDGRLLGLGKLDFGRGDRGDVGFLESEVGLPDLLHVVELHVDVLGGEVGLGVLGLLVHLQLRVYHFQHLKLLLQRVPLDLQEGVVVRLLYLQEVLSEIFQDFALRREAAHCRRALPVLHRVVLPDHVPHPQQQHPRVAEALEALHFEVVYRVYEPLALHIPPVHLRLRLRQKFIVVEAFDVVRSV